MIAAQKVRQYGLHLCTAWGLGFRKSRLSRGSIGLGLRRNRFSIAWPVGQKGRERWRKSKSPSSENQKGVRLNHMNIQWPKCSGTACLVNSFIHFNFPSIRLSEILNYNSYQSKWILEHVRLGNYCWELKREYVKYAIDHESLYA